MRLTLRTTIAMLWATLGPACSSLGGVELQDGEGRFTAGDDGDPGDGRPDPYPHDPDDDDDDDAGDDEGSEGSSGDRPLEPPSGTTDGGESSGDSDSDSDAADESASASESTGASDGGDTGDGGTTTDEPQTNGVEEASSSGTAGPCDDPECLPPCEPDVCGQPCGDDVAEGSACAGEGGAAATCELGVWSCPA